MAEPSSSDKPATSAAVGPPGPSALRDPLHAAALESPEEWLAWIPDRDRRQPEACRTDAPALRIGGTSARSSAPCTMAHDIPISPLFAQPNFKTRCSAEA